MNSAFIYDVILIAVILVSAFVMSGKGLLKILYKVSSIVVTIIVVTTCSSAFGDVIKSSPAGEKIAESVETYVVSHNSDDGSESITVMPEYITETVEDIKTNTVAPAITDVIISVISAICIYLVVKLLLYFLLFFVKGLFKLPVLKQVNRLAGICVGSVSGIIIVYIVCAIVSLNIANSEEIRAIIDNTYLVKYFYDNNLLMTLFI